MRRVVSTFLSILFSFWLITPAFSTPSVNDLPACCRRAGKHHCEMGTKSATDGPSLSGTRCAQFQWQGPTIAPQTVALAAPAPVVCPIEFRAFVTPVEAQFITSTDRLEAHPRGPPQL